MTDQSAQDLTVEQLVPLIIGVGRYEAAARAGATLLRPPLPRCPSCGARPENIGAETSTSLAVLDPPSFLTFAPCGHRFRASSADLAEAHLLAPLPEEHPGPDVRATTPRSSR